MHGHMKTLQNTPSWPSQSMKTKSVSRRERRHPAVLAAARQRARPPVPIPRPAPPVQPPARRRRGWTGDARAVCTKPCRQPETEV